jgi:hypothetical protein
VVDSFHCELDCILIGISHLFETGYFILYKHNSKGSTKNSNLNFFFLYDEVCIQVVHVGPHAAHERNKYSPPFSLLLLLSSTYENRGCYFFSYMMKFLFTQSS